MARAGYNPKAAISIRQRMDEEVGKGSSPEFLSDHRSHHTRNSQLET